MLFYIPKQVVYIPYQNPIQIQKHARIAVKLHVSIKTTYQNIAYFAVDIKPTVFVLDAVDVGNE